MNLNFADTTQPVNKPEPEPAPIFRVVPTPVPTPVPAPAPIDTVQLSQTAELRLLHSEGEDQTQINARLGWPVAAPVAEANAPGTAAAD